MFLAEILKKSEFLSENFHLLVVKFSIYLNRRVFVMRVTCGGRKRSPLYFTIVQFIFLFLWDR